MQGDVKEGENAVWITNKHNILNTFNLKKKNTHMVWKQIYHFSMACRIFKTPSCLEQSLI